MLALLNNVVYDMVKNVYEEETREVQISFLAIVILYLIIAINFFSFVLTIRSFL